MQATIEPRLLPFLAVLSHSGAEHPNDRYAATNLSYERAAVGRDLPLAVVCCVFWLGDRQVAPCGQLRTNAASIRLPQSGQSAVNSQVVANSQLRLKQAVNYSPQKRSL